MSKFIITGGKKLAGEIQVSGSKNSGLALMAASLLSSEKSVLTNVPAIEDVEVMSKLISGLGVAVDYQKSAKKLTIDPSGLDKFNPDPALTSKLRASILLVGPLLARMKEVVLSSSGGDKIGVRTIEPHIAGLTLLGAQVSNGEGYHFSIPNGLKGNTIVLEETSVTATENLLMAASLAEGTTVIKLAAMEPHVGQLIQFLNGMGAKISGMGSPTLIVEGVASLRGGAAEVIPDSNEAATFITLAAAVKGDVTVSHLNPEFLDDFLLKMKQFGVNFEIGKDFVHVKEPQQPYQAVSKLQVGLYPKLASDDAPPLAVLATQAVGETIIYEWMYENRLGYSSELNKMGAKTEILDPHRVKIIGPIPLYGAQLESYDIRMGITLVIAALVAQGQSQIHSIEHIDRGYENLEQRLAGLGADIKRL